MSTTIQSQQDKFQRAFRPETLFRHKWTALLAFVTVLLLTAAFLLVRSRDYHSNAKLLVRIGRESVTLDPTTAATGQVMGMTQSQKRQIQSVLDLLNSRALLESVVEELGPEAVVDGKKEGNSNVKTANWLNGVRDYLVAVKLADPTDERESAIRHLGKHMSVGAEPDSDVVSLMARGRTPEQAQEIGVSLVRNFEQLHLTAHNSSGSFRFFESQADQVKTELDAAEVALRDAKNEGNLASIEGQRAVLEGQLLSLEQSLQVSRAALEGSRAKSEAMRESLSTLPERIVLEEVIGLTNTAKDQMRTELYRKQLAKAGIESRYTEDHPLRSQIQNEIDAATEVYGNENEISQQKMGVNVAHQNFKLAMLTEEAVHRMEVARVGDLEAQIETVHARIRDLNSRVGKITDLERNVTLLDEKYRNYVESLEKTRIDEALDRDRVTSVNVFQKPSYNGDPQDFSNTIVALAGLVAAVIAALFTAFLLGYIGDRLSTADDVERELQIPVFITIPNKRAQRITV